MGRSYNDKETGIKTSYGFWIEGIRVELNDSWYPGATIWLHRLVLCAFSVRELLYTTADCAKELLWTLPTPKYLCDGVEIGYWADGYIRHEMLATEEEVDEIATRAVYGAQGEAHIAVTHALSVGTSTVWLKVYRSREYWPKYIFDVDVRFCVEFANSQECTRFLHEDMRKLEHRDILKQQSDIGVIEDIISALDPIHDDLNVATSKAARRGLPFSEFLDKYPQPDTQVIRRRASNWGDDRPCFLTLHLSTTSFHWITRVDWSATTLPPTSPSPSGTFRSLNNLHLKFPSPISHDRDHNSTSRSRQKDLTITISGGQISFSTGTCSISPEKGSTLSSQHCTVNINNYINKIMGDAFFGTVNGGNNGGRNNVNNTCITSPVGSRSPRILCPLPRRPTPLLRAQAESQGGVGRWVQPRPSRPRPY